MPTNESTDRRKIPDLLDFAVTKGITDLHINIGSNFDINSDMNANITWRKPQPTLCSKETNWETFETHINRTINLNWRLQTPDEIEDAVEYII